MSLSKISPTQLLLVGAAGVLMSSPGVAQSADQRSEAGVDSISSGEIIVTAQRRSESINKVPISITAATQEQLDRQGVKDIEDLTRITPGLSETPSGTGDNNYAIRGVISNVGAATTGFYIDETPVSSRYICFYCGFTATPKLFDLERVEVLRGPQGTLFGAGSEGGTIRFITPEPGLSRYTGYARAELSTTEYGAPSWETGVAVGGPIVNDVLGFRASAWTRRDGGYIDLIDRLTGSVTKRNSNSRNSYVGRIALALKPTPDITLTPSFFYQKLNIADREAFWPEAGTFKSYTPQRQPSQDEQKIASFVAKWDGPGFSARSITSYYDRAQNRLDDYTYSDLAYYAFVTDPLPSLPNYRSSNYQDTRQRNFTQELRFSTTGNGPIAATAGLYYAHNKTSFTQNQTGDFDSLTEIVYGATAPEVFGYPYAGPNVEYFEHDAQLDKEYAAYADVTWKITPRLKVSGGARVSHDTFDLSIATAGVFGGPVPTIYRSGKATPVTPRATVSYDVGSLLLYVNAAKGFRVGGGNTSLAGVGACAADLATLGFKDVPEDYKSDSVWSYEAGLKKTLAHGRGHIAGSVFQVDWKDIQTVITLPTCGFSYNANVGKARIRGFDMQASYEVLPSVLLNASVAYTDARNLNSITQNGNTVVSAGSHLQIPQWTATVGAEYTMHLAGIGEFYSRADYQYAGAYTAGHVPTDLGYDAATNAVDASNFLSLRSGIRYHQADLSVFVNNLLNARPLLSRFHEVVGTGNIRAVTLRPRTVGATATYRF